MQTVTTLEEEWGQVLQACMSMKARENESSTGWVWAAGFHHVMACSRLEGILKIILSLFT
jgi:hypothetical protein